MDPGTQAISQAMSLISQGFLDDHSIKELAEKLQISDRHLRRLFIQSLGISPVVFAQTRRILFAKQLLNETPLSITDIAFASGFNSLRRFNEAISQTYGKTPGALRRRSPEQSNSTPEISLKLPFSSPYHWESMVDFLAPRTIPGVESVTPHSYQRTVEINGDYGIVQVEPVLDKTYLRATIQFPNLTALAQIVERLRHVFDLDANITEIEAHLQQDSLLSPLIQAKPGVRVLGAWDGFETAVRAILGQQISVAAATRLAGRLVETYGEPLPFIGLDHFSNLSRIFPKPATLAKVNLAELGELGLFKTRAHAITSLAKVLVEQPNFFQTCSPLEEIIQNLCKLPRIGEWTAHYIALRVWREPDAFPASDLGLLKAIYPGQKLTKIQLLTLAQPWQPWRAYGAMHLWMKDFMTVEIRTNCN